MTNHRISYDAFPPARGTRTKMDILIERRDFLREELAKAESYLIGLDQTGCNLSCDCGTVFHTEADFASHFIIPDERFLNLGNCPVKD